MSLTDHYNPYEFASPDEGPGCGGDGHGADCLCDVSQELCDAVPAKNTFGELHYLAARLTQTPTNGAELQRWASELLGMHDIIVGAAKPVVRYTNEQKREVKRLRSLGESYGRIEELTGVTKAGAYAIVKRSK